MNVNIAQGTSPEQAQPRFDTDPSLSGLSFFGVLRSEFAKLLAQRCAPGSPSGCRRSGRSGSR